MGEVLLCFVVIGIACAVFRAGTRWVGVALSRIGDRWAVPASTLPVARAGGRAYAPRHQWVDGERVWLPLVGGVLSLAAVLVGVPLLFVWFVSHHAPAPRHVTPLLRAPVVAPATTPASSPRL